MLLRFKFVQDVPKYHAIDIHVPLKSSLQYGSLWSHILSLRRRGRGLCHSTMFCGPGNTWQADTDSVNNSKKTKTKKQNQYIKDMNRSQTRCEQKRKKVTDFILSAIDFKEWDGAFAIDLVAWRMSQITFCLVRTKDKSFTQWCTAYRPQWGRFSPNASADTSDSWGTWGRTRRGREWAVMSVLVGRGRSTRASVGAGQARYTLCSSYVWWCRHGYGRTPDSQSCGVQLECRQNCPGNPGGAQYQR